MKKIAKFLVGLCLALGLAPGLARAQAPVQVQIVVIEATKRAGQPMDPALKARKLAAQLEALGYTGAKISDQLNAKVGVRARVSLSMFEGTPRERKLTVAVREVGEDGTIRLQITLDKPVVKLKTDHKNGGTALVAHPSSKEAALFLAITPKLSPPKPLGRGGQRRRPPPRSMSRT